LNDTLISKTNFVQVTHLHGHSRYTYDSEGSNGFAFSEPREIIHMDIKDHLLMLRDNIIHGGSIMYKTRVNEMLIQALADKIRAVRNESKQENEQFDITDYGINYDTLSKYPLVEAIVEIRKFIVEHDLQLGFVLQNRY
jgi:hypothetical protein